MDLFRNHKGLILKFCGIATEESIRMCEKIEGIDALGFITEPFKEDTDGDVLSKGRVISLIKKVPDSLVSVLLIKSDDLSYVLPLVEQVNPDVVQLQKEVKSWEIAAEIRKKHKEIGIIKTFTVTKESTVESVMNEISVFEAYIDAVNLDSKRPGHGCVHNWELSAKIVPYLHERSLKFVLAGGLNMYNLEEAICQVHPDMVDIMTGARVEENGEPVKTKLDLRKVECIAGIVKKFKL